MMSEKQIEMNRNMIIQLCEYYIASKEQLKKDNKHEAFVKMYEEFMNVISPYFWEDEMWKGLPYDIMETNLNLRTGG